MMKYRSGVAGAVGAMIAILAAVGTAQEKIGSTSQPLHTSRDVILWTTQNNECPVCWETEGYEREKKIVREAVAGTWEFHSNIRFTGWGPCPKSGDAEHVRIRITPQGTENSGAGGAARLGTAALSKASDDDPGVTLSFNPDGSADVGRVEYVAVHEFGHVLGFIHEQDAPGNEGPAKCTDGLDPDADAVAITGYDRDSVMNYCNRDGNMTGHLTDIDIEGVQKIYGVRRKNVAPPTSTSTPSTQRASLVGMWNDQSRTTFSVFPSDSSKFTYPKHWAIKQGGWGNTVKWVTADFNRDKRTDVGAIWDNGGKSTLTVWLSDGKTFKPEHWMPSAGGWSDETVWMGGDFNGDGLGDMAGAWHDGNHTSIAVYLSDGTKFLAPKQWSLRDGGWSRTVKWMAGDFNGDGRTDIGAAWNNQGTTTLSVRVSDGSKFTPEHWRGNAGRWFDAAAFAAGDFNKDGLDDVAQMWNDIGRNSITVFLSQRLRVGSRVVRVFDRPALWANRDGGQPDGYTWIAGDYNGDGYTDIAAAWNNKGKSTLTVRTSTGSKFNTAHWAVDVGGWSPTTAWRAGAFETAESGGTLAANGFVTVLLDTDIYDVPDGKSRVIGVLYAETKDVTLLESQGSWHHVKMPAGQGWVYSGEGHESLDLR